MDDGERKSPALFAGLEQGHPVGNDTIQHDGDAVKGQIEKYSEVLYTRYMLQRHLQAVHYSRFFEDPDTFNPRFWSCSKFPVDDVVSLWQHKQSFSSHYTGLAHCGNSVCCPVCVSNIATGRAGEIKSAVSSWLAEDEKNTCFMVTLTFAHRLSDPLPDLFRDFWFAREIFWRNGSLRRYLKRAGVIGRITGTEVQFSDDYGWHPHQHVLLFARRSLDVSSDILEKYYLSALQDAGLSGLSGIALNVTECRESSSYICKSGLSVEMALGHLKRGRGIGHYSPMQLAAESFHGMKWATNRFFELMFAVRGKHFLYWSPGLKRRFGLVERSDDELAENSGDALAEKLLDLYAYDWRNLSTFQRVKLQIVAATGDIGALERQCDEYGVHHWRNYKKGGRIL